MTTKIRGRMVVSERAKQFMPFKAVAGLDEALERKRLELGIVERRELSEEELLELDQRFSEIKKDDVLIITFFTSEGYKTVSDKVKEISLEFRYIVLGDIKIQLDDITEIY